MTAVSSSMYARIAGVLTLGVFAADVYIGLYDKVLQEVKVHWYLDWIHRCCNASCCGPLTCKALDSLDSCAGWSSLAGCLCF